MFIRIEKVKVLKPTEKMIEDYKRNPHSATNVVAFDIELLDPFKAKDLKEHFNSYISYLPRFGFGETRPILFESAQREYVTEAELDDIFDDEFLVLDGHIVCKNKDVEAIKTYMIAPNNELKNLSLAEDELLVLY
ncbi:hypothetical protein ACHJH3_06935 [Campylobacter sp. MOP7]|uniref:hypothetical protein n=1 Tax=Campylobacter canis TaxID=3378588 RepID=UPI00387E54BA